MKVMYESVATGYIGHTEQSKFGVDMSFSNILLDTWRVNINQTWSC